MNLNDKILEKLFIEKNNRDNFIFLGKGGSGVVYKYDNIAIKIIPKEKFDENEYKINLYMSNLVKENITSNFLLIYNLHQFERYVALEIELADGDLYKWITNNNSDKDWLKMILQIMISLRIVQKKINFYHRDLKPKNILFKKSNIESEIKYIIDNNVYIINTDTIFFITDFTHSISNITNTKINDDYINDDTDLHELQNLPKRLKVDKIIKKYTLDKIIDIGKTSSIGENFKSYLNDEIKKTDLRLKKYPLHIKDNFLKRSLIYYLLEYFILDEKIDVMSDFIQSILESILNLDLDDKIKEIYEIFNKLV